MATIAALIGSQIIGGIGTSISEGLREQQRRQEWNKLFDFNQSKFDFQKDFSNRQLQQNYDLTMRQQNLSAGSSLLNTGMNVGSSIIGNLLSYNHAQDVLDFQKSLNIQRRTDLQNEGLPLSYLHLQGGFQRSVPNIPMMRTQTFGRDVSNPWGFANSGSNLRQTYGPPPSYAEINSPNAGRPGFDPVSGYPK